MKMQMVFIGIVCFSSFLFSQQESASVRFTISASVIAPPKGFNKSFSIQRDSPKDIGLAILEINYRKIKIDQNIEERNTLIENVCKF